VVDADGNLYWWESQSGSVAQPIDQMLVSVDADGNLRFRAPLDIVPEPLWEGAPGVLLLAGDLLLLAEYSGDFTATTARLAADEHGAAYAQTGESELTSWDRDGHERWRQSWPHHFSPAWQPMGVYGRHLVVGDLVVDLATLAGATPYVPAQWTAVHGTAPI